MNVTYSDRSQQVGEYRALLQQATERLEDILGPSAALVNVQWDRIEDSRGRSLYRLTIKDFTGEASTDFAPEELQNPTHMHVRLYRLWGDLLQVRSNKQHEKVQAISGQINGGHEEH